jgi:arylsulfatase A-like enzyme
MGLYDDTIFVIYGDHGEGFGEHDLNQHDNTIYEEGIRIPLIIHDPMRFHSGERVMTLTNETDILPTVSDLLGYEVEGGEYPGRSLLASSKEDRTLFFSCFDDYRCLASLKGEEKYRGEVHLLLRQPARRGLRSVIGPLRVKRSRRRTRRQGAGGPAERGSRLVLEGQRHL